jgi:hypothetical protein
MCDFDQHDRMSLPATVYDVALWFGMRPECRRSCVMRRHIELPGLRWCQIDPAPNNGPALAPFDAGHDLFSHGSLVMVLAP